jgi:RNA polymerase sigma-70 factor (ECF subfamily)
MDQMRDDDLLLKRLAGGDQQALKLLFMRNSPRIYRFVQRLVRNEAVAEELTNEVFIDVWRGAKGFAGQSSATTWMFTIARNKAFSHLRRRREETMPEDGMDEIADTAPDPEVSVLVDNKAAALRKCIDALPLDHRTVVDLVYYQEMSVADVAVVVGVPEGTVKTRLFNARKKLSENMRAAGIDRGWP